MLPKRHRIRTGADFSRTVRSGARVGGRNIVVSARIKNADDPSVSVTRVGLIVSKAVGNAVKRNLVSRRLREASKELITESGEQNRPHIDYVIRALPNSATADYHTLKHNLVEQAARAVAKAEAHIGHTHSTKGSAE